MKLFCQRSNFCLVLQFLNESQQEIVNCQNTILSMAFHSTLYPFKYYDRTPILQPVLSSLSKPSASHSFQPVSSASYSMNIPQYPPSALYQNHILCINIDPLSPITSTEVKHSLSQDSYKLYCISSRMIMVVQSQLYRWNTKSRLIFYQFQG